MSSNDVLRRVIEEAFAAQDRVDAARIVESADLANLGPKQREYFREILTDILSQFPERT